MNSLVSLSGLSGLLFQQTTKSESFDDTQMMSGVVLVLMILVFSVLSIVFLVTIYQMVPNNKVLHTVLSLFFGFFYFMPMLAYLVLGKNYTLKLSK